VADHTPRASLAPVIQTMQKDKRAVTRAIDELEGKLAPRHVDLDVVPDQLSRIADILAHGSPQQQRRAPVDLFDR